MLRPHLHPILIGLSLLFVPAAAGWVAGWWRDSAEFGARFAGVGFELCGLFIVWRGLENTAEALGLDGTAARVRNWRTRVWDIATRKTPWKISGTGHATLRPMTVNAEGRTGVPRGTTPESRLDAIEKAQDEIFSELDRMRAKAREDLQRLGDRVSLVEQKTAAAVAQISTTVREVAGGGLHAEAFGLVLVFLGAMTTTFPELFALLWPFSAIATPCAPGALGVCFAD